MGRWLDIHHDLSVLYRETGEAFSVPFDPKRVADGKLAQNPLRRPAFLAIVSLENLVKALVQSQSGAPDGFIIEHHTAGGHNAGPQGPLKKDSLGQPIYGSQDEPDLQAIRSVGLLTRVIADAVADGLMARAGAARGDAKPAEGAR